MTENVHIRAPRRLAGRRRGKTLGAAGLLGAAALAGALVQPPPAALAASGDHTAHTAHTAKGPSASHGSNELVTGDSTSTAELPSPLKPPSGLPRQPPGYTPPTGVAAAPSGTLTPQAQATAAQARPRAAARARAAATNLTHAASTTPAAARTWGASGAATTLVLYDTTNTFGWLGELYAIGAGNLATHFGKVTAEPVVDYQAGQVNDYTATIYLGSTYNEPIPTAFLDDVLTTAKPVIWAGDNIWQLSGASGSAADNAFKAAYGWDPATSYFDTADSIPSITYKGQNFTRSLENAAGILAPHVTTASAVTTLATANCADSTGTAIACNEIAQTTGTSFPWAISSRNLMYLGEIPFSYMSMTDRYVAFSDLLFDDLAPNATASHLALIRLEDISPASDPANLEEFASYLKSQGVPFSMAVIPQYMDPNGYYSKGIPASQSLLGSPIVPAIDQGLADGGTLVQHGYTHQYSNVDNPFDGVSADDFEFYRAQCAATATAPYTFQAPCPNTDYVVETGPVSGDSQLWATTRTLTGKALFALAGLPTPAIWTTPHYAASAADYAGIDTLYSTRYEQELFFGGELTGGAIDYGRAFGQFFPYEVHDLYGATVIPENLGDYEPVAEYGNPPRLAQDIINEAQQNLAVTQGVASLFIHSDYDPLSALQQIVTGLKAQGYTFVSPSTLLSTNG
jgi:uncharacterized protein YdaL